MNPAYDLQKRILGAEYDPETGEDNLRELANQTLEATKTGFARPENGGLEELGLYILAMACKSKDDKIPVYKN
jgi:hypothetical protein